MQPELNFKEERKSTARKLRQLENIIAFYFEQSPDLRELKNRNELIRTIWSQVDPSIPAESITRIARKIQATGAYDTTNNQTHRANQETSYREYF